MRSYFSEAKQFLTKRLNLTAPPLVPTQEALLRQQDNLVLQAPKTRSLSKRHQIVVQLLIVALHQQDVNQRLNTLQQAGIYAANAEQAKRCSGLYQLEVDAHTQSDANPDAKRFETYFQAAQSTREGSPFRDDVVSRSLQYLHTVPSASARMENGLVLAQLSEQGDKNCEIAIRAALAAERDFRETEPSARPNAHVYVLINLLGSTNRGALREDIVARALELNAFVPDASTRLHWYSGLGAYATPGSKSERLAAEGFGTTFAALKDEPRLDHLLRNAVRQPRQEGGSRLVMKTALTLLKGRAQRSTDARKRPSARSAFVHANA